MSRSLASEIVSAIVGPHTEPKFLIRMIAGSPQKKIATWDSAVSWNSEVWAASGVEVEELDISGGRLRLPNDDDDEWIDFINSDFQGQTIQVYAHYKDWNSSPQTANAVLIFTGELDRHDIDPRGRITITFDESRQVKVFPPTSLGPPVHNHLLPVGSILHYGNEKVFVN